jgi:hypothetical protein
MTLESCGQCGGAVHPVAGRCKHCRADLHDARVARARALKQAQRAADAKLSAGPPLGSSTVKIQRPHAGGGGRAWLWVAAVAVLLFSVAGGVLAHQLVTRSRRVEGTHALGTASAAQLTLDAFAPSDDGSADPLAGDPDPGHLDPFDSLSPFGGLDPFALLDPGGGLLGPRKPRAPRSPGQRPDVGKVDRFAPALAETVCEKIGACTGVDLPSDMCAEVAQGDPLVDELVERVRKGECRYDAHAAAGCIDALAGMSCDGDPQQLLAMADGLESCVRAFDCQ